MDAAAGLAAAYAARIGRWPEAADYARRYGVAFVTLDSIVQASFDADRARERAA
jgi:hypothetical protein